MQPPPIPAVIHHCRQPIRPLPPPASFVPPPGRLYCPTVKFYSTGHHLPRLEDERCPGTLPCPCQGGRELCLATEGGSIDIPRGNTTVVQVGHWPAATHPCRTAIPSGISWTHRYQPLMNFNSLDSGSSTPVPQSRGAMRHSAPCLAPGRLLQPVGLL